MKRSVIASLAMTYIFISYNCSCSSTKKCTGSTTPVVQDSTKSYSDLSQYKMLPIKANKTYTLESIWDLQGETYMLPEGVTLKSIGGVFKNGILIGNNTKIEPEQRLFDKVRIEGMWDVPEITTSYFVDLNYVNSLRDVLALANPVVNNTILIEKGKYWVSVSKSSECALTIPSNSTLILDGIIELTPNDFRGYNIVYITGENVHIRGDGEIIGDKFTHKGGDGEWGMGVMFADATGCTLSGLSIKNCWGDCVYVGDNSSNIIISKCKLDNGRRQGVSITSGRNITISDCVISNVYGISPEFAVDIEPNDNESVDGIKIERVTIEDCGGGITTKASGENSIIENITIEDCKVLGSIKFYSYRVRNVKGLTMQNCIGDFIGDETILFQHNENVIAKNNCVNRNRSPYKIQKCKNTTIDRVKQ